MTEIRVIKPKPNPDPFGPPTIDVLYLTKYRYDEAGNRIRKTRWEYTGSDPDPVFDLTGDASPCLTYTALAGEVTLQSDEFYVRDVSGKEIAIYSGSSLTQWNIWGLDNVGKINSDTTRNYYLKDHLGSIRVVLNSTNSVISAQDYDAWGYLLENRTYNNSAIKYDFTGKERDDETSYDYFGARYYDSRIGRWGQVEPLVEKYISYSPYLYSIVNPILLTDIDGRKLYVGGDRQTSLEYIKSMFYSVDQERITMNDNGEININVEGIDLENDAAFDLVNKLVSSSESFLFEVNNEAIGLKRNTDTEIITDMSTDREGVENYSITESNINGGSGNPGLKPKDGYSGQVTLGTGYWTHSGSNIKQPASNIVFHELAENYFRTVGKEPYMRDDEKRTGAHSNAITYAGKYKKQEGTPGKVGKYIHENK